ncbi:hypothetical protein ACHAXA_009432 [Cyclostephanos tholiformis]|uniref:Sulfotransferase n=1 Tax=Cyclostephanos tholiformis TaxID=382380 RepID=A0ABD3RGC9_9STRA
MQRWGRKRGNGVVVIIGRRTSPSAVEGADDVSNVIEKSSRGVGGYRNRRHGAPRCHRPSPHYLPVVLIVATTALAVSLFALSRDRSWDDDREAIPTTTRSSMMVRGERRRPMGGEEERPRHLHPRRTPPPRSTNTTTSFSSIDAVVTYLKELATCTPDRLWDALGMDMGMGYEGTTTHGDDPFMLKSLEGGICPWTDANDLSSDAPWLPSKPHDSDVLSATYRANLERARGEDGSSPPTNATAERDDSVVAIWYEHVSKAGGTTFCALAKTNMEIWQVPEYHCMPSRGTNDFYSPYVGTWTNDVLMRYVAINKHAIVSSEWDPFRLSRLSLSGRYLDGGGILVHDSNYEDDRDDVARGDNVNSGPRLLFVTTLRDPCDRLLSAYTFFEVTRKHNARNYKPPAFDDWMDDNAKRAAKYERGTGKRYGLTGWTTNHNHVTWRFSGGLLPSNISRGNVDDGWTIPFEVAVRALCQFDLILPMDVMTKDGLGKLALRRLLGWTNFEARIDRRPTGGDRDDVDAAAKSGHVVSTGNIQNSNARSYFSKEQYRQLWEDNWLDHILYLWCRAVFLARLHCNFDNIM